MILLRERIGKLISEVEHLIYSEKYPIEEYRMLKTEERFSDVNQISTAGWQVIGKDHLWGGHREFYYFYTEFTVPEVCDGKPLVYELRTGKEGDWDAVNPQFLVYINGVTRQGLDVNHREILLTENACGGEVFQILLSAYTGDNNFSLFMDSEIKVLERDIEKYYYDIKVPYETALLLESDSREYIQIIQSLNESLNLLDLRKEYSGEFYRSLAEAQDYITEEFYEKLCGNEKEVICCVGHTHIDCAWLWTLATTKDKAVRSFSTVLELMRRYPEYKFMSSQPQLYDYVKQNAPEVFEEIKQRVAEGRWETEGGMWVEADCNISSGESLVRQFIYGLRFFREEFGRKNEILWLPDVFGYSAALPQIMKKCGIKYFMTTKISWNEFNQMPYDTFMWEGLDGTEVLTHFSSSRDYCGVTDPRRNSFFTTYNAMLNPSQVKGNWMRYGQKELQTESLMTYGYGDGGGGPTGWMLENARRMEKGIPGCPKVKHGHALPFFKKLERDVEGNKYLPKWVGELYLEYHRGTYTSMARNKRYNRKSEFAYENLEFYALLAEKLLGIEYPKQVLRESWEVILRNQFHDIIPGSSIKEVYEDSKEEYEKILRIANEETERILQQLADAVETSKENSLGGKTNGIYAAEASDTDEKGGKLCDVVVFNPNNVSVETIVYIDANGWTENGECSKQRILDVGSEKANEQQIVSNVNKSETKQQIVSDESKAQIRQQVVTDEDKMRIEQWVLADDENEFDLQKTEDGYIAVVSDLPSKGYRTYSIRKKGCAGQDESQSISGFESGIENDSLKPYAMIRSLTEVETNWFSVRLNENGQFISIYDKKRDREIIPEGKIANQIITYEDKPHNYDAWDINNYYTEKCWEVNEASVIEITENGPVRACLKIERPYLDSVIVQYLYFYRDLDRIDIKNEIDWKEEHILVRDYFPVDIHADEAVFEIQYGNVKRPTHSNTMWDFAKFEVCSHKWLDVSEDGYGVSMLNDCKYGCSVKNGVIGMTMLKSALYPNPEADKEHHTFWYSICPHEGDFRQGNTVGKAYMFNNPPRAVVKNGICSGGVSGSENTEVLPAGSKGQVLESRLPRMMETVKTDASNVVIEVVKQAEETSDCVIRLYETCNRRGKIVIDIAWPFAEAWESDMLENPLKQLKTDKGRITAEMKPYEIKTIILKTDFE